MAVNHSKPVQTQGRGDHRSQRPLAFVNLGFFICTVVTAIEDYLSGYF